MFPEERKKSVLFCGIYKPETAVETGRIKGTLIIMPVKSWIILLVVGFFFGTDLTIKEVAIRPGTIFITGETIVIFLNYACIFSNTIENCD